MVVCAVAGSRCDGSAVAIPGADPATTRYRRERTRIRILKLPDFVREIAYPMTQPVMVLALLFFWALLVIGNKAGLPGLFLLAVSLPAYVRYLLAILEARAHGRQPEPPSLEMFSLVDSLWTLFPLVPVAAIVWFEVFLFSRAISAETRVVIGTLPVLVFVLLAPASLTILTMTRSPLASINPLLVGRVIGRSMPGYVLIPMAILAVSAGLYGLSVAGTPGPLLGLGGSYLLFLSCSLTGGVMHRNGMQLDVDIPDAVGIDQSSLDMKLRGDRQAIANHAYGFISRGNRDGGLKHIRDRIDAEADPDDAWHWFFDEMTRWESTDAVLFFAQPYLSRLLRLDQDAAAIRVLTRCLHRNPRFRPLEQDRQLLTQLLKKCHREDLLAQLES